MFSIISKIKIDTFSKRPKTLVMLQVLVKNLFPKKAEVPLVKEINVLLKERVVVSPTVQFLAVLVSQLI
jgi:hypothetical protein